MFDTRAIEFRTGGETAILPTIVAVDRFVEESSERRRLAAEQALDQVLADSFPASDPPSWNPGIVRADPAVSRVGYQTANDEVSPPGPSGSEIRDTVVLVSKPVATERSFFQRVVSFAAALGTALILPLAILVIGLPVALAVRGLLELIGWVFGANLL